ncbi:beta-ketoacyl synthase N-terminal-like domain-containing protein [Streptomyces sp. M19]
MADRRLDPEEWSVPYARVPGAGLRRPFRTRAPGHPLDGPGHRPGRGRPARPALRRPGTARRHRRRGRHGPRRRRGSPGAGGSRASARTPAWCWAPAPEAPEHHGLHRDSLVGDRPFYVDPARFPNTVLNSAAGRSAIWHRLKGPNATVAGGHATGLLALRYAMRLQRAGRATTVVCGAVEEFSSARAWLEWHARTDPGEFRRARRGRRRLAAGARRARAGARPRGARRGRRAGVRVRPERRRGPPGPRRGGRRAAGAHRHRPGQGVGGRRLAGAGRPWRRRTGRAVRRAGPPRAAAAGRGRRARRHLRRLGGLPDRGRALPGRARRGASRQPGPGHHGGPGRRGRRGPAAHPVTGRRPGTGTGTTSHRHRHRLRTKGTPWRTPRSYWNWRTCAPSSPTSSTWTRRR